MSTSVTLNTLKSDVKVIAADIASVGASVGAVLAVVENAASSLHIAGPETAIIVAVSTAVSAVVLEARRVVGALSSSKKTAGA
jgi:hypothetical protein